MYTSDVDKLPWAEVVSVVPTLRLEEGPWGLAAEPGCYLLESSNTHPHAPISGAPRASPVSSLLTFRSAHKCHFL